MFVRMLHPLTNKLLNEINDFENLTFETCNPGGHTIAGFTEHRAVTQYWEDLQPFNLVNIGEGESLLWEGYLDTPARSIKPDAVNVGCLGWSARLNECGTAADVNVINAANNQASDFISSVLNADSDCGIIGSNIETTDFEYAVGTRFEFSPFTTYFNALEQFNAASNFDWGSWGRELYWKAKTPSVIDWFVYTNDCDSLTITPNPAAFCNEVIVSYTQDGTHQQTTTRSDTDSQSKYGRVVKRLLDIPGRITTTNAQSVGDLYLAETAEIKVAAEFTCKRIFDSRGAVRNLAEVRAGENVSILDWLPTEELLARNVNDIATFQIKSTTYSHNEPSLQITPTEFVPQIEVKLAQLEAVGY